MSGFGEAPAAGQGAAMTLTQVNAAAAQEHSNRISGAIEAALQGKLSPPPVPEGAVDPKAPKGRRATSGAVPASTARSSASNTSQPSKPNGATSQIDSPSSQPAAETSGPAASDSPTASPETSEPPSSEDSTESSDPTEEAPWTPDRSAVEGLAKKRDLRGLEKALGLEEGVLGATNGEYAAVRRRQDELAGQRTQLIQKFGPVADLIGLAQKGDLRAFAATIERTGGIPIAKFVELWAQNIQQVPAQQMQQWQQAPQQQPPQAAPQTDAEARSAAIARADGYIAEQAGKHPVMQLRGAKEEVREAWLQSHDGQRFTKTPQQCADAVLAERKLQAQREMSILTGKQPAAPARTRTVNRSEANNAKDRREPPMTREQAIEYHAAQMRAGKRKTG